MHVRPPPRALPDDRGAASLHERPSEPRDLGHTPARDAGLGGAVEERACRSSPDDAREDDVRRRVTVLIRRVDKQVDAVVERGGGEAREGCEVEVRGDGGRGVLAARVVGEDARTGLSMGRIISGRFNAQRGRLHMKRTVWMRMGLSPVFLYRCLRPARIAFIGSSESASACSFGA